jgi:23S rRNA (uracil1939-C5)-methyltransferase
MSDTEKRIDGLKIHRWASGGDGIGIPDEGPMQGMVLFVPGTVPGDVVDAVIVKKKKRWGRAKVVKIVETSPQRREPPCAHQEACGGCPWMPGSRDLQLEARMEALRGEVKKQLGWSEERLMQDVCSDPDPGPELGYRHRLRMAYRRVGDKLFLGFREGGGNRIADVDTCVVATPAIQAALPELRAKLMTLGDGKGEVWLVSGGDDVAISIEPEDGPKIAMGASEVQVPVSHGLSIRAASGLFVQANPYAVERMAAHIEKLAKDATGFHAVELFAGAGTFTVPLLKAGFTVQSYEANPAAQAPYGELVSGLGEAEHHECNLYKERAPVPAPKQAHLILSDPPRTGASDLIPWMIQSGAHTVLLIACDLATGLRDAGLLIAEGYELHSITSFDMFPNTGHQELVLHLGKLP